MHHLLRSIALCILVVFPAAAFDLVVDHDIRAEIDPAAGRLSIVDRLRLPDAGEWLFYLHRDLDLRAEGEDVTLERVADQGHLSAYRLVTGASTVAMRYAGTIRHALVDLREGMGRERQFSRGTITPEGVVLDGYSGWYPRVPESGQRFEMTVALPAGWQLISQGVGGAPVAEGEGVRVNYSEQHPQDDIHLVAAPFVRYARETPWADALVYLRQPDDALAGRYLDATGEYLGFYSDLIGAYPYSRFALVENFWETGYGMPSFTLLGSRVIRLPFILHTSYPHEILHNWWGNGVFVDYSNGNWSEGLTAYLADHLLAERAGRGAAYRRDRLQEYADYVRDAEDIPISAFRARHGAASQAIGYGKTLMVFHMLRRALGDDVFVAALRGFYRGNRFELAGFDELRAAFEQASGRSLERYFEQWTTRSGAPRLALESVGVEPAADGYRLRGVIAQVQDAPPYPLVSTIVVHLADGTPVERTIVFEGRRKSFDIPLDVAPVRISLDPLHDTFRRLEPGERPVTLSALFGAERGLIVLPTDSSAELRDAYASLAASWTAGDAGWEVRDDDVLDELPDDRAVWLLGWDNRFIDRLTGADDLGLDVPARALTLAGQAFAGDRNSLVIVRGRDDAAPIGWLAAQDAAAVAGLARKVPHYGRYSYLVFDGLAPDNRLKGQWPTGDSSLSRWLDDAPPALLTWPERVALGARGD